MSSPHTQNHIDVGQCGRDACEEAAQRECHGQEGELATDDPDDAAQREVEEAQARPLVRLGLGQRRPHGAGRAAATSDRTRAGKFEIR